jgi:hypothetical protein
VKGTGFDSAAGARLKLHLRPEGLRPSLRWQQLYDGGVARSVATYRNDGFLNKTRDKNISRWRPHGDSNLFRNQI